TKSRRVGLPCSQASTSADRPASKSRLSRSFMSFPSQGRCFPVSRANLATLLTGTLPPGEALRLPSGISQFGRRLLFAEAPAVFRQALLPWLRPEHVAVDDAGRDAAVLEFEHRPDVRGAAAGEALIGPAERMRRQDDVVELQD